jgi:hypothetical protein
MIVLKLCRRPMSALLFAAFLVPVAAHADTEKIIAEGWWGGFKGADFVLTVDRDNNAYRATLGIQSAGIVHWLTNLMVNSGAEGTVDPSRFDPEHYEQHVISKRSETWLGIRYDGTPPVAEKVKDEHVVFISDPDRRDPETVPDLTPDLRTGTQDPISAALDIGRKVLAGDVHFVVPVFDGRRRYDLETQIIGPRRHDIHGIWRNTIDTKVTIHVVAGFRADHVKWWDKSVLNVFFDRTSGLPMWIESSSFMASLVIGVTGICGPETACERSAN